MFGNIGMKTTINDLDTSPDEIDQEFDNDDANDKSYLTSDDSTVDWLSKNYALSVIKQYCNLDATLQSTPQYGFMKGMKEFRK